MATSAALLFFRKILGLAESGKLTLYPTDTQSRTLETDAEAALNSLMAARPGDTAGGHAASGALGEYHALILSSAGSLITNNNGTTATTSPGAVALTTATAANVLALSLGAGDWDVEANVHLAASSATVTARIVGLGATTATLPTDGSEAYNSAHLTTTSETDSIALTRQRFSLAAPATVYLVAKCTFSAGTMAAFGRISARRVR